MGGKKKLSSKASKLARMTEEEKLRYLQHRAAVEQEATRRRQQLISSFLKNKLKHEEAFTRLNSAKINQQWRQTLRQIKCKELQDTTETLRQTFDVAIKTKNKIIQNLLLDLKDCETQHAMALEFHLEAVDKLLDVYKVRGMLLYNRYVETKKLLIDDAIKRKENLTTYFDELKESLENVILASNKKLGETLEAFEIDKSNKIDQISYDIIFDRSSFEEVKTIEVDRLNEDIVQIMTTYVEKMEPVERQYLRLRSRDESDRILQENNCKVILNFEKNISRLLHCHCEEENKFKTKRDNLISVVGGLKKCKDNLRSYLTDENNVSQKKLLTLAVTSGSVLQYLKKFSNKSDQIQLLVGNCKKYLTEKEKVLPSFCTKPDQDMQGVLDNNTIKDSMKHFWLRYSELLLECQKLKKHNEEFLRENSQLKCVMRHYLTTVSSTK